MIKIKRQNVKGELYQGREYVGKILKVADGYQVWRVENGYGEPILGGRVFNAADFRKAGRLDLGYAVVLKYELAC